MYFSKMINQLHINYNIKKKKIYIYSICRERNNNMKIILIGLPKSGTSSFQFLFKKLGLKSFHWTYKEKHIGSIIKKNKNEKKRLLNGIENWDCLTQLDVCISHDDNCWPQITDLHQLYEENKDCLFILNKRDPEKMLKSWKNWNQMDQRVYKFNPEIVEKKSDDGLVDFFKSHFKNVESFFESKPNANFLSYDIETDSLDKLRKYIHIKQFTTLPRKNISKK